MLRTAVTVMAHIETLPDSEGWGGPNNYQFGVFRLSKVMPPPHFAERIHFKNQALLGVRFEFQSLTNKFVSTIRV